MFEKERDLYLHRHGFEGMHLKAVLFDMDGVLFDSMKNHAEAWHKAMTSLGFDFPKAEAYMHEGRTGAGTINLISQRQWHRDATEEEKERIYKLKSDLFNALPTAEPMPGAWELLQQLKEDSITPILVTGSGQQSLLERLNKHFPDTFHQELMVTAYDVKYGKPNPEPYLIGQKKGKLEKYEGMVVENAPLGVEAASKAGLFTVAVNTGPLPDDVLWNAGADVLLHSMTELSEKWEALRECLQQ